MPCLLLFLTLIVIIEIAFRPRLLRHKGGCELAYGISKRKYIKLW